MRLNSPLKFIVLTISVSWVCWAGSAVVGIDTSSITAQRRGFATFLIYLGAMTPSLVAVGLTFVNEGKLGVATLLSRLLEGQVAVRWYLFAMGFGVAIRITAALVMRLITGTWPAFGTESVLVIAAAIVIGTPFAAGEEVGWRGYALPRMASSSGFARAGILLGVIHASWHIPLFFLPGHGLFGQSFPMYLLIVTSLSVAFTWLYVNTSGSLLLATLFHSAWNQTTGLVPTQLSEPGSPLVIDTQLISILVVTLLLGSAAYFTIRIARAGVQIEVVER